VQCWFDRYSTEPPVIAILPGMCRSSVSCVSRVGVTRAVVAPMAWFGCRCPHECAVDERAHDDVVGVPRRLQIHFTSRRVPPSEFSTEQADDEWFVDERARGEFQSRRNLVGIESTHF
jgi:hypothetical protein